METQYAPNDTVDSRPKHIEDEAENQSLAETALVRGGIDASNLAQMSLDQQGELASLQRAYPEGPMFLRAFAVFARTHGL